MSDGNRLKEGQGPGNREPASPVTLDGGEAAAGVGAGLEASDGEAGDSRGSLGGRRATTAAGLGAFGPPDDRHEEDLILRERVSSRERTRLLEATDAARGDFGPTTTTADEDAGSGGWDHKESLGSGGRSGERGSTSPSLSSTLERLANKQFVIESAEAEIEAGFPFAGVGSPFDVKYLL